ncbi:hypothetical protein [Micromonospora sp. NPDC001898]|uniref:hypothetical protein n=1 Tax=Micromonospora sp. NPDC001898 TaxID=3364221 RepID=UPI003679E182
MTTELTYEERASGFASAYALAKPDPLGPVEHGGQVVLKLLRAFPQGGRAAGAAQAAPTVSRWPS